MGQTLRWTMSRGTIWDRNRVYVCAYSTREPGTRIFRWTGKWDNYYVPSITAGICSVRLSDPEILTVGIDGLSYSASPSGQQSVLIDSGPEGPNHRGVLRTARAVGSDVYAAGMGRQVYRRDASRTWHRADEGLVEPIGTASAVGIEAIDGFLHGELYAAGRDGEMWMQRSGWTPIDSPTNASLLALLCGPDGLVYVGGQVGTLLVGRSESWRVTEHKVTEDHFWDLCWFDGLWLSTTKGLFRLVKDELQPVDMGLQPKPSTRYLDAHDGVLWSFGSNDLAFFDGATWRHVPLP
jgi:hypothetical protein